VICESALSPQLRKIFGLKDGLLRGEPTVISQSPVDAGRLYADRNTAGYFVPIASVRFLEHCLRARDYRPLTLRLFCFEKDGTLWIGTDTGLSHWFNDANTLKSTALAILDQSHLFLS